MFERLDPDPFPRCEGASLPRPGSKVPLRPQLQHGGAAMSPACARCLALGHVKCHCCWPVKCHACFASGHVSASCPQPAIKSRQATDKGKGKTAPIKLLSWFSSSTHLGPSQPPLFNSFGELVAALSPPWAKPKLVPELIVTWHLCSDSSQVGRERPYLNALTYLDPLAWSLATSSPSPDSYMSAATPPPSEEENVNSKLQCTPSPPVNEL